MRVGGGGGGCEGVGGGVAGWKEMGRGGGGKAETRGTVHAVTMGRAGWRLGGVAWAGSRVRHGGCRGGWLRGAPKGIFG